MYNTVYYHFITLVRSFVRLAGFVRTPNPTIPRIRHCLVGLCMVLRSIRS